MLGVNVKSARFSTLKKYRFLTSSNAVIRLVGGVLLVALFALVPNRVSAYSIPISIPGNDESYRMTATHNILGGCLFQEYTLLNGSRPYLGKLLDGSHNCGYRPYGNLSYYSDSPVGYSRAVYNGISSTYDTSTYGGYSILNDWSSGSNVETYGQNAYNTLNNISLNLQKCPVNAPNCSYALNLRSNVNGSAIFVYAYKDNLPTGSVGTTPKLSSSGSGVSLYNYDGTSYSGSQTVSEYSDLVSDSLIYGSYSSDQLQNLLPENLQFMNKGDEYQYIIGSMPLYNDHYALFPLLNFVPNDGIKYNWALSNALDFPNVQGGVLNLNGYFNFLNYPLGESYKNGGLGINYFALQDSIFAISLCENSDECDNYSNYVSMYKDMHNSSINEPVGSSGSQSIFMSWFNIFNFGLLFPFTNFFQAFTDSNSCVSVPVIGGMLHNPNAQYCSWWSSSIRNVLTPVFSLGSIMLIFGFIIHWLRSNDTALGETKGGKK